MAVFDPVLNLSDLDGSNGFVINGMSGNAGNAISGAGDINGDGIDDLIIGARGASANGTSLSGQSYVVFGNSQGFSASFNLSQLNGNNGFTLNGIGLFNQSGWSVSGAGDVNHDGIDDLIIGAPYVDIGAGQSYVIFGKRQGFSTSLNLSALDGSNGFVINGINSGNLFTVGDLSGFSVSDAGDFNGDGIDDLLIGARGASRNGKTYVGESYVIFGNAQGFSSSFELSALNGSNGLVIRGIDAYDGSGNSVSGAGDINGDGLDDLIIGTYIGTEKPNESGESYVVFGSRNNFSAGLNLSDLDGSNGFVMNGIDAGDLAGVAVSRAGDINGDGLGDLIIGADSADPNGNREAGESYVVFGKRQGFSASLNLSDLNGSNGFVINGINTKDYTGSVSSAGDVNGDGIDDLIIGAYGADPNGRSAAGASYVVFGSRTGFGASLNLADLNGSNGFVINGIDANDSSGAAVSGVGDVNGDGIDDLMIGAPLADPNGTANAGESYVIFGRDTVEEAEDHDPPTVRLSIADAKVTEGNQGRTAIAFTLSLSEVSTQSITVQYQTQNGSAIAGEDFVAASGRLTIPAGESSATISVDVIGDPIIESNEIFALILSNPTHAILQDRQGIGTILNDGDLTGTPQSDRIRGTNKNDVIQGRGDNDTLIGKSGDDVIAGEPGNDTIRGGNGKDSLNGGDGNDRLVGGQDNDRIRGESGNDILRGGSGNDILQGGTGNDRLDGQAGNDVIETGRGRDRISMRRDQGFDRVKDFQSTRDLIDLVQISFRQLTLQQRQDDVLVKLGSENILLLEKTELSDINRSNFV